MSNQPVFSTLDYEDFRNLAKDPTLSKYEKIGFPDSYREGYESVIFDDIKYKLSNLTANNKNILDIGPGCADVPMMLIDLCRKNQHQLTLIDSREMLDHLPDESFISKIAALFPVCPDFVTSCRGKLDVILCYSVLHYILMDTAFFRFLDISLSLLAPAGQMLIGDIPNISKRKRFFSSEQGVRFHQAFMNVTEKPEVVFNNIEHDHVDDAVIFAILQRARLAGFDAYVVPQSHSLPMANRREDILIVRP